MEYLGYLAVGSAAGLVSGLFGLGGQQEVCDVVMQQRSVNQVTGYKTYIEFGGNVWQMTTTIPYTKGEFLSVNVDITPAE